MPVCACLQALASLGPQAALATGGKALPDAPPPASARAAAAAATMSRVEADVDDYLAALGSDVDDENDDEVSSACSSLLVRGSDDGSGDGCDGGCNCGCDGDVSYSAVHRGLCVDGGGGVGWWSAMRASCHLLSFSSPLCAHRCLRSTAFCWRLWQRQPCHRCQASPSPQRQRCLTSRQLLRHQAVRSRTVAILFA